MINVADYFKRDPEAFERGYSRVNALQTDQARMRAGNALSGGNYAAAAGELFNAGDVDTGARVAYYGQRRDADLADQKQAKQKLAWTTIGEVASSLMGVYQRSQGDKAKLVEAFDMLTPRLQEVGETPDEITQTRARLLADPENTLTALGAAVKQQDSGYTLSPGSIRYDQNNKEVARAPFAPFAPEVVKYQNGPSEEVVVVDRNQAGGDAPRSVRNHNPGNIKDGPFAQSLPGYAGADGDGFARFNTPEAGRNGQQQLLASYGQRGFNTVKSIIDRWAPPSDNNPTQAYIDFVARKLGVSPRETLDMQNPEVLATLGDAIAEFEGGSQSASSGARIVAQGAPKPQDQSADQARTFTQENQLRNQFGNQTAVKDMASVRAHVATIGAIAQKAQRGEPVTAADDLALIFAFMKMLDPGSVVREGEFANAQNTAGVPDRIVNAYNRALNGTRLSDKQRDEFFQTATTVMDNYSNAYADQADRSRSVASSYGLSPDRVAAAPNRPRPRGKQAAREGDIPTVRSPAEARSLPPGTRFRTPDGRVKVR